MRRSTAGSSGGVQRSMPSTDSSLRKGRRSSSAAGRGQAGARVGRGWASACEAHVCMLTGRLCVGMQPAQPVPFTVQHNAYSGIANPQRTGRERDIEQIGQGVGGQLHKPRVRQHLRCESRRSVCEIDAPITAWAACLGCLPSQARCAGTQPVGQCAACCAQGRPAHLRRALVLTPADAPHLLGSEQPHLGIADGGAAGAQQGKEGRSAGGGRHFPCTSRGTSVHAMGMHAAVHAACRRAVLHLASMECKGCQHGAPRPRSREV